MVLYIAAGFVGFALLWAVLIYNRLVRSKQMVEEGWSGIDVQLRRRANLIPNLVTIVKAYAGHEQAVLEKITDLRQQALAAESGGDSMAMASAETRLSSEIVRIFAIAENYPDLRANSNFLELHNSLSEIEEQIQLARRYYNGAVRELNIMVDAVPSNIVARIFGFIKAIYFAVSADNERNTPQIKI